jgi:hypothetical protein
MKKTVFRKTIKATVVLYIVAVVSILVLVNACKKNSTTTTAGTSPIRQAAVSSSSHPLHSGIVNIAGIRPSTDGQTVQVLFNERAQIFTVSKNAPFITTLTDALENNQALKITTDPWQGTILEATLASSNDRQTAHSATISSKGIMYAYDLSKKENINVIDQVGAMGVANPTTSGYTYVIPDFATAQLMFTYCAQQCCKLQGPYGVSPCIPFQYVIDGCYARAHKMKWILETRYQYECQKIFSFANQGNDVLAVRAEKWGGCCVTWWYHVAPLVTIKTPTGPKAYVFDPGMFDEPVLLSTWLKAQTNASCAGSQVAHVSMFTVQPATAYDPANMAGTMFSTDPGYIQTDQTLIGYDTLKTCP